MQYQRPISQETQYFLNSDFGINKLRKKKKKPPGLPSSKE
ncbi:620_t:CDS:2 [Racocetra fulgida]|uniref:620_t:CDS:1 n=1 Tax=Racocetra fulgida TaxID=60492 RepID=A0A9N8YW83_9GLOM|nr:620_t:CDS:2 [Racocetra fulgida]